MIPNGPDTKKRTADLCDEEVAGITNQADLPPHPTHSLISRGVRKPNPRYPVERDANILSYQLNTLAFDGKKEDHNAHDRKLHRKG